LVALAGPAHTLNAPTALDNFSGRGQMASDRFIDVLAGAAVTIESIGSRNRRVFFEGRERDRPRATATYIPSKPISPFRESAWGHISSTALKERALQNGRTNTRRPRPVGSFTARAKGTGTNAAHSASNGFQSAQRNYERYLALAQDEARSGNVIGAENYYQHAEHYFRLMSST
jgi:hypothetical protein